MNKWLAFVAFYVLLGLSVSYESSPWVRLAWLLPILALWLASYVGAFKWAWKNRHLKGGDWQPTHSWFAFPKSWRSWISGEPKHRS